MAEGERSSESVCDGSSPSAPELAALHAAIDDAALVSLWSMSADALAGWAVELQRISARIDSLVASGVAAADRGAVHAGRGVRTLPDYVGREALVDSRTVARQRALGRWVDQYPELAAAFAAGQLSQRHVEALRAAENSRTRPAFAGAQGLFIELATTLLWNEFNQALRYWVLAADPDGEEPAEQVRARRCVTRKRFDGSVEGNFRLDPLAGQTLLSALDQEEQRLFRADTAAGITRSPAQRRADALVRLASRGATRDNGTIPAPLLHLVAGNGDRSTRSRRRESNRRPRSNHTRVPYLSQERRSRRSKGTLQHRRMYRALSLGSKPIT